MTTSSMALSAFIIFWFGFFVGAGTMLSDWENSAKRGSFEVGHTIYKAERILP